MTTWADDLEDRLGIKLYGDKMQRYEAILNAPVSDGGFAANTTNDELRGMVRFLAEKNTGKPEHITVEKIWSWLRWYRKERSAWRKGYKADTPAGFIAMVWGKMREASNDPLRVWNIACAPHLTIGASRDTTLAENRALLDRAEAEGLLPHNYEPRCGIPGCRLCDGTMRQVSAAIVRNMLPSKTENEELPF